MRLCGVRSYSPVSHVKSCHKLTLLHHNPGIDSRTEDSVFSQLRLKKIGFVFQTFNLLSSLTALENVEMPMILDGTLSAAERRQRAICSSALEFITMCQRPSLIKSDPCFCRTYNHSVIGEGWNGWSSQPYAFAALGR
jgi:hypothetical protein